VGNYIGTDDAGAGGLGSGIAGVNISGGPDGGPTGNVIGGTTGAERNIISGNGAGVLLWAQADGNFDEGNYSGTAPTGQLAVPNNFGVVVLGSAENNVIGGALPDSRNVISGNTSDGVQLRDGTTTGNYVLSNYIGTDASGTHAHGNGGNGILIDGGANGNWSGDGIAGANVIFAKGLRGIEIRDAGTDNNVVLGNFIGIGSNRQALGNTLSGIFIHGGARDNQIGTFNQGQIISGNYVFSN